MSDWLDEASPDERERFDEWVAHVRREAVQKMEESAFVASLVPGEVDVKFAVELGISIMLDKPILAICMPGRPIPPKLRLVADVVVEADVDTEEGRLEIVAAIERMSERLGG